MSFIDFEITYDLYPDKTIAIQYIPVLEVDARLRKSLGSTIHIKTSNCPEVKPIFLEIESHLPQKREVSIGSMTAYTSNQIHNIQKYVSATFEGPLDNGKRDSVKCDYHEILLGQSTRREIWIPINQLSRAIRMSVKDIDSWAIGKVRKHFYSNLPVQTNLPKIVNKIKIFLSLRGKYLPQGEYLHNKLKEYGNESLFEPYIFSLDMAPGRWVSQLEESIDNSNIFMPLLTEDYYKGHISVQEHDQAIRKAEADTEMTIVPVLLEGTERDYQGKFIGNYTFKKIPMDVDNVEYNKHFEELVSFLLTPPK